MNFGKLNWIKRAWIGMVILSFAALSACSLSSRVDSVLFALRSTPTSTMTTLKIPGDRLVQFYIDQGFSIDKNQGVINNNRIVMKSADGSMTVSLSAYQGEVVNATLWVPMDPNNVLAQQKNKVLVDFLGLILPNWSDRETWLQQTIESASKNFSDGRGDFYTIYDAPGGAEIELSLSSSSRNVVLLIFSRQVT